MIGAIRLPDPVVSPPGAHTVERKDAEAKVKAIVGNEPVAAQFKEISYSLPGRVLLGQTFSPRIRIVKAIPADISQEGRVIVACWAATNEFGSGSTLSEALEDLSRSIVELFLALIDEAALGPDLQKIRSRLSDHIELRG
jgi:hypothetical protein